jgi:hypothetical protein
MACSGKVALKVYLTLEELSTVAYLAKQCCLSNSTFAK